jgi:hypothetical protein
VKEASLNGLFPVQSAAQESVQALWRSPHVIVRFARLIITLVMLPWRVKLRQVVEDALRVRRNGQRRLLGGVKRQLRRSPEGGAHQGHGPEHIRADERAIGRDRRAEVMPDDSGHGTIAERRDQTQRVPDEVGQAKGSKVAVVSVIPSRRAPVAALIRGDDVISRRRKRAHDSPPRVCEFRKAMEKRDEGPPVGLESSLEHVDRESVNVVDHAGADAGWQRGIAVGRKAAGAHTNDGRAFRDHGTANRRGRGCQTSLPADQMERARP